MNNETAIIRLGTSDEKTAILDESRLESLAEELQRLSREPGLRGLVIAGPSPSGFSGGADISLIERVEDRALGARLAARGQEIYSQIAQLPVPTVAAIGGACVGGGCELVLACRWRIALNTPETKIGLPEVRLGIIPGFGGTQRLPRLIGLPKALGVILAGKVLPAKKAADLGLIDLLVPVPAGAGPEEAYVQLVETAVRAARGETALRRKSLSLGDRIFTFTGFGRKVAAKKAKSSVLKETKGKYPAPLMALDAALYGLERGIEQGFAKEAQLLGEAIVTAESKSLVHLYQLSETASKFGRQAVSEISDAPVAVIGGGVMGAGIASCFVTRRHKTIVVEPDAEQRKRAKGHIEREIAARKWLPESERAEMRGMVEITEDLSKASQAQLVVEAIVEDLDIKRKVFGTLAAQLAPSAVVASNTSSLSIGAIAEGLPRPERVVGLHFFNPAEKMPLVEIVRSGSTADEVIVLAAAFVSDLGKYPVVVEDVPGFLVNRILSPYIAEAAALLAEGISIDRIDRAAVNFGMPMGPFRLLDEVGLDVAAKVRSEMIAAYGERMESPDFLKPLLDAGRRGKKNGLGFYLHSGEESLDASVYELLNLPPPVRDVAEESICQRLIFAMVNEAVRCLDEGVAGAPGPEAAGQIDLATVMGMGFAPFRGGVLWYASSLGAKAVYDKLEPLSDAMPARFAPTGGIVSRAQLGRSFFEAAS